MENEAERKYGKIFDLDFCPKDVLSIMLYREHYYTVIMNHKVQCPICKQKYYITNDYFEEEHPKKHKCNIKAAAYANEKLKLCLKGQYKSKFNKKDGTYTLNFSDLD